MLFLLRQRARRDRWIVPLWVVAAGLLALSAASAGSSAYGDAAERAQVVRLAVVTPALLALRGVPDGASVGSFAFFEVFTYIALLAGLMSTFLVVRHTRQDEERGRAELLAAAPVGRAAPLLATIVALLGANVLLALLTVLGLIAGGLPAGGSILTGVAAGAAGLAFGAVAAVIAQLAPTSRAANAVSGGAVVLAWALRAIGDALGEPGGLTSHSAWPSWLSPIGWGQQTFPFSRPDAAPLLLAVAVAVVGLVIALVAQSRRDLGSSLVPQRAGRARGRLRTTSALAWRLHRSTVIGWTLGGVLFGLLAGGLGSVATNALEGAPQIGALLDSFVPGGHGALLDTFVAAIVGIAGVLAAAAGAQAVTRARGDESDGRVELLLAAPVARVRWLGEWMLVGASSALAVCVGTGLVAGLAFLAGGEGGDRVASSLGAGLAQLPAALVYVALAGILFVLVPRASTGVTWVLLAIGLLLGQFGGLLQLPEGVRDVSPFFHTPGVPATSVDWSGAWWLAGAAIVMAAVALLLARRRQVGM